MEEPKPTYELVKDVTGKTTPNSGKRTINVYGTEMRVPYPPKYGCKKCYGRGFTGIISSTKQVILCRRCYPSP